VNGNLLAALRESDFTRRRGRKPDGEAVALFWTCWPSSGSGPDLPVAAYNVSARQHADRGGGSRLGDCWAWRRDSLMAQDRAVAIVADVLAPRYRTFSDLTGKILLESASDLGMVVDNAKGMGSVRQVPSGRSAKQRIGSFQEQEETLRRA
jgi:hypothetical protein